MFRKWVWFSAVLVIVAPQTATPQELDIVSSGIQRIAIALEIPKRLGLIEEPNPENFQRYFGLLAATDVAAQTIAEMNGRKRRSTADVLVGFWLWCWFPPNKPPPEKGPDPKSRARLAKPALYNKEFRSKLRKAIGKRPASIAKRLYKHLPPSLTNASKAFARGKINVESLVKLAPELNSPPKWNDLNLSLLR